MRTKDLNKIIKRHLNELLELCKQNKVSHLSLTIFNDDDEETIMASNSVSEKRNIHVFESKRKSK